MSSNGPPTPNGVGGPTPPLVSRGSEEEGGTRKSTEGLPSSDRERKPTSPPRYEEEAPSSKKERGGLFRNRKGDEEPPLPKEEGKALSCHKEGYMITGRAEERTEKRKGIASSTDQEIRHDELTRAGNYAC